MALLHRALLLQTHVEMFKSKTVSYFGNAFVYNQSFHQQVHESTKLQIQKLGIRE